MDAGRRQRRLGLAKQCKVGGREAPAGLALRGCEPDPDIVAPEKPGAARAAKPARASTREEKQKQPQNIIWIL